MSDEKPGRKADGDLDFGFSSVARHDGTVDSPAAPIQDKILGEGDTFQAPPPEQILRDAGISVVEPPPPLAVNQATMECTRGPCLNYWCIISRFDAQGDRIFLGRTRQCNAHAEPLPLAEENVFHCGLWWPTVMSWVPVSLRPVLRPRLRALWDWWLKRRGYNFDWKWWQNDVFEADRPEQRGAVALGALPGVKDARKAGSELMKEGLTETADGVFWSGK